MPEWAWDGAFVFIGALAGALASGAVAWFLERKRLGWEANRLRERLATALDAELELLAAGVEAALRDDDPLATMTTIATLRPLMTVFLSNTDQLGSLEANLARNIIGAYQNAHHFIDRGHEMWQEVERELDARLRATAIQRAREDAADYVPRIRTWLESIPSLRQRLSRIT
jgi:hypothetical protein